MASYSKLFNVSPVLEGVVSKYGKYTGVLGFLNQGVRGSVLVE